MCAICASLGAWANAEPGIDNKAAATSAFTFMLSLLLLGFAGDYVFRSDAMRARIAATIRLQRSPAKPKTSAVAVSMSRDNASRRSVRARNNRVRTVAG